MATRFARTDGDIAGSADDVRIARIVRSLHRALQRTRFHDVVSAVRAAYDDKPI